MKQLLVLCPHLPPLNGADAQRVRVMLPHLGAHGWRATVVAVEDPALHSTTEPGLTARVEAHAEIIRVRPWSRAACARIGFRQLALRAYAPLRSVIDQLLAKRRFDAAFVSTTEFALWPLSLRWPMPVVLDWQDPWWTDYYDANPSAPRPGGAMRFAAMQAIARRYEPKVAARAAAHIVVSPRYRELLQARYPALRAKPFQVLPFAASADDLVLAGSEGESEVPGREWVCVGRGGPDLEHAARAFLRALSRARTEAPASIEGLKVRFVGTAYDAVRSPKRFAQWAESEGVADLVDEQPERVGQLAMLRRIMRAEALLVLGSDDPAYQPSRLATYRLSGRPTLALLHAESAARAESVTWPAWRVVPIRPIPGHLDADADAVFRAWFDRELPQAEGIDESRLGGYGAAHMTATLAAVFDSAMGEARAA